MRHTILTWLPNTLFYKGTYSCIYKSRFTFHFDIHFQSTQYLKSPVSQLLLNRLFRRRSKKTSSASPVTGEFPAQMASNAEKVSIWWRHHGQRPKVQACRKLNGWLYHIYNIFIFRWKKKQYAVYISRNGRNFCEIIFENIVAYSNGIENCISFIRS